jgi:hypothetical protein
MSSLTDFIARKGPTTLLTDTLPAAGAAAATPATGSQPDLTNRLLQIMSGQLGGTLTGGEKLSALGALLKSVSRGSQTSPQDVVRGIQQQKMAEVQGALQIQQLRKAAAEKAQSDALKAEYVSQLSQSNPQLARAIALMSPEKFADFVIQQNKEPQLSSYGRRIVESFGVKPGSEAFKALMAYQLSLPTTEVTPTGTTTYAGLNPYATSVDASGKKFIQMKQGGPWLSAE